MCWLPLALASAILTATKNVITRRLVFLTDTETIIYAEFLLSSLFTFVLVLFTGVPEIKPAFYYSISIASIIDVIAVVFFVKAIASAQLAKTIPLVAFTPIFLIGTSFVILGELPSFFGLMGIVVIVFGAYLLKLESIRTGLLEPIKCLWRDKSSRYMLLAAFLFRAPNKMEQ